MARWLLALLAILLVSIAIAGASTAAPPEPSQKTPPQRSGAYDFSNLSSEFEVGIGNVQKLDCTVDLASQPAIYAGNSLIDCDGEVPHNETSIAVDPNDPNHAVGAYHSYQRSQVGANAITHILGVTSVTFDGGQSWREVVPPIAPYQFSGDPAVAFDANGRVYFANIADHEGPTGHFTNPSIIVVYSDDGGLTYSSPVTIASGKSTESSPVGIFQDKEFIAVDTSAASPYRNRVYVTWSSFQYRRAGSNQYDRSPIMESHSDDGVNWSVPQEISGSNPSCSVQFGGGPAGECDEDELSVPTVAPDGRVFVAFENFNTPAENQYMVVSSADGGTTWSNPVRVDAVFDVNYPNDPISGRIVLTGCQFRMNAAGNIVADPTDPSGDTLYLAWSDNRNGSGSATNVDVLLARSTDGGLSWNVFNIDGAPNDQFYPWAAVGPDGTVNVGYMDRSYSSGQSVCQYGFSLTRLTFGENGTITAPSKGRVDSGLSDADHSRWFSAQTGGQSLFIGDYNGIAVGSDGRTWSLWTDQRNLVANPPSPSRNHGQHAVAGIVPAD